MAIYDSVAQLTGRTPLLRLTKLSALYGCRTPILAKLECFNPTGSVKDRAVFSMLLVVLGAQAYRTTVDGASAHTRKRIAAAFVRNAVRAQDERGAIAVEDRDGLPVLALTSEWDGERYVQYIYGYQGQLCELFTAAEYDFAPEDGEPVCAAQAFEPTLAGDLLTVRVTDETGHVSTVYIARRCAQ